VLGVQGDDRGPGPGAAPPPRDPRAAQGARRNLNPPPASDYDFGAPSIRPPRGGVPNRRSLPEQNFAPGAPPDYYGPPPDFRRGAPPPDARRGPPPRQDFRRGAPRPQSYGPPEQQFNYGRLPQQRFDRGAPNSPRAGFRDGGSFGAGGATRGRRSFR
jgi:hypothetical protein